MSPQQLLNSKLEEVADLLDQRNRELVEFQQRHDADLGKLAAAERRATAAEARVTAFEREKATAKKAKEEAAAPLEGFGEIATGGRVRG